MYSCPCSGGWAFSRRLRCTEQPPQASQIPHNPRPAFVGRKARSKAQSQAEVVPAAQVGRETLTSLSYNFMGLGVRERPTWATHSLQDVVSALSQDNHGRLMSSGLGMDTVQGSGPDATPSSLQDPENSPQPLSPCPTACKVGTIILLPSSISQDFEGSIQFSLTEAFQLLTDK